MEIWKRWLHNYEVSSDGRIRNVTNGRILKQRIRSNGYADITVTLGSRESRKTFKVHRIVAQVFLPNPDNLPQINHKDGNKLNNSISNLEWCDQSHNIQEAFRTGLMHGHGIVGSKNSNAKLDDDKVIYIRSSNASNKELAKQFGVSPNSISQIRLGKTWKHLL